MTTQKFSKSKVFSLAHKLFKANLFSSFGAALKCAWSQVKNSFSMKNGVTFFQFKKKDGSIREAFGTLREGIIPESKGTGRKKNPFIQTYFDMERMSFRSYKVENLISVITK